MSVGITSWTEYPGSNASVTHLAHYYVRCGFTVLGVRPGSRVPSGQRLAPASHDFYDRHDQWPPSASLLGFYPSGVALAFDDYADESIVGKFEESVGEPLSAPCIVGDKHRWYLYYLENQDWIRFQVPTPMNLQLLDLSSRGVLLPPSYIPDGALRRYAWLDQSNVQPKPIVGALRRYLQDRALLCDAERYGGARFSHA